MTATTDNALSTIRELVPWPLPVAALPIVAFLIGGLAAAIPTTAAIIVIGRLTE